MSEIAPVITVDGPGGAGKGTIAKRLAGKLGWHLLDSGAIYRVLAIAQKHQHIPLEDIDALEKLALNLPVEFQAVDTKIEILLDGKVVTGEVRLEETGQLASKVAVLQPVREALLARQRAFRQPPGLVADGRDMGTVVFTDAPLKLFLDASQQERAQRRFLELQAKGVNVSLDNLFSEIQERDLRDRQRAASPLKPADDAICVDTTELSIDDVFLSVWQEVESRGLA